MYRFDRYSYKLGTDFIDNVII